MPTPPAEPTLAPLPASPPSTNLPALDLGSREPIRGELFGLETLEAHARAVAASCRVAPAVRRAGPLLQRLAHNERLLVQAHRRIRARADRKEALSPDAEWLLDNFYIVEDVLREVRHDLPRGYYRELPKL